MLCLINLKVANKLALLRFIFRAFARWKLETTIDKRLLDQKQKTFLLHNTKMEIQRSKMALQKLYRQQYEQ